MLGKLEHGEQGIANGVWTWGGASDSFFFFQIGIIVGPASHAGGRRGQTYHGGGRPGYHHTRAGTESDQERSTPRYIMQQHQDHHNEGRVQMGMQK